MTNYKTNSEKSLVSDKRKLALEAILKVGNPELIALWRMVVAKKRLYLIKDENDDRTKT